MLSSFPHVSSHFLSWFFFSHCDWLPCPDWLHLFLPCKSMCCPPSLSQFVVVLVFLRDFLVFWFHSLPAAFRVCLFFCGFLPRSDQFACVWTDFWVWPPPASSYVSIFRIVSQEILLDWTFTLHLGPKSLFLRQRPFFLLCCFMWHFSRCQVWHLFKKNLNISQLQRIYLLKHFNCIVLHFSK